MKNLISKNPVLRFKIIKAQLGIKAPLKKTPFEKAGENYGIKTNNNGNRYFTDYYGLNYFENGDIYSENGRFLGTNSRFRQLYNNRKNATNNKIKAKTNNSNNITTQEDWDKYFVSNALLHRELEDAEYAKLLKSNNQNSTSKSVKAASKSLLRTNSPKLPKNQTNVTTPSRVQKRVNTVTSPRFRNMEIQKGWTRNYGNELWNKITDELKNILKSTGLFKDDSFKDAKSLQAALNNYFTGKYGSLNDNGSYSQIAVDDKWGNQSLKAFNEALSLALMQLASPSFSITQDRMTYYPNIPTFSNVPKIITRTTYDRNGIRNKLRTFGLNPYSYSGALRKALRMLANNTGNDNDRLLVRQMNLSPELLLKLNISLKKGGLISKNPVERFNQSFTLGAGL